MNKRRQKSSRVTWAPDVDLCQVRLFLLEDCPSQVGINPDDHLQAKTPWMLHSNCMDLDDPPPGFEVNRYSDPFKKEGYHIPLIKWKCPLKFILNNNWHVAAGEESKECEAQKQREISILEAIYPRPSAIPASPSVSPDVEECNYDDCQTPIIPVTPIEEDDATDMSYAAETPPTVAGSSNTTAELLHIAASAVSPNPHVDKKSPLGMLAGLEADVFAAASAAFTALMKSSEQGSMIDTDLLIKILSEPKLIELLKDVGSLDTAKTVPRASLIPSSTSECQAVSLEKPANETLKSVAALARESDKPLPQNSENLIPKTSLNPSMVLPKQAAPMLNLEVATTAALPRKPGSSNAATQPNLVTFPPSVSSPAPSLSPLLGPFRAPLVKDANYYKSLVKQHGMERQEAGEEMGRRDSYPSVAAMNSVSGDVKPKNRKPCIFFNSTKGCRNGLNCPYQHDPLLQLRADGMLPESRSSKRMKPMGEIAGRT
ncbi:hypothetical protein Nepgr_008374 [Nepenthes gracilis]|uniref:C3H1-type domain-containing protein n=1 Tax=Nepenthes gracilis TaxID=150966 RepID=A0AAD3S962_NEPGR|nr:hypothetical protein Nepgr_008374 [Nepenthes gracilis]